jgi:hypothetical protein
VYDVRAFPIPPAGAKQRMKKSRRKNPKPFRDRLRKSRANSARSEQIRSDRALGPSKGERLKALLATAPLAGIDLTREDDFGREHDL